MTWMESCSVKFSRVIHSYSVFTSTNHIFFIVIPVLYGSIVEVLQS